MFKLRRCTILDLIAATDLRKAGTGRIVDQYSRFV